jgi:hypothetical protein
VKADNLVSLRAAARELQIDRATLARIVTERGVLAAGKRAGHDVFEYETLRRAVDLEWYGGSSSPTVGATCDECWGFINRHKYGRPCPPGWHEYSQEVLLGAWDRASRKLGKEWERRVRALGAK